LVGENHAPALRRLEHAVLLLGREAREERQDLGALRMVLAQRLRGLADLALARKEDEDVAGAAAMRDLIHRLGDRLVHVHRLVVLFLHFEIFRPIANLDRVGPPGHFDHRRAIEERREAFRLDRSGGDHDTELGAHGHEPLHVTQQEIEVEAALVRLVDDERVVGAQLPVRMRLRE
jgi:hypothetical protein